MSTNPAEAISSKPEPMPRLTRPLAEVDELIHRLTQEAMELIGRLPSPNEAEYDETARQFSGWVSFSRDSLRPCFDTDAVAVEFVGAVRQRSVPLGTAALKTYDKLLEQRLRNGVARLESIERRLPLWEASENRQLTVDNTTRDGENRRVFVVHGHSGHAKEATARFLEKIGLEPVILHEQPSQGATLIEKIEAHSDVCFAIVLLTPDGVGALAGGSPVDLRPRARQDVIFELGYFIGRLGRTRVAAILEPPLDHPSDISGVVYIPFDPEGAWKLKLGHELATVFDFDFSAIR